MGDAYFYRMKYLLLLLIFSSTLTTSAQVVSFNIDESKLDKPLVQLLDSIFQKDQKVRITYMEAKKEGKDAALTDSLLKKMHKIDQQNLATVDALLRKKGWLGPQKVGIIGSQAIFLVIQHADLSTQEHYLPVIRAAEKKGEILSSNVAILEDRVNMRQGKKQEYGSQGFTDPQTGKKYIYPIIDVDLLDNRRAAMGMPPMQEYVKDWDLEKYKRELPEIEKIVLQQKIR